MLFWIALIPLVLAGCSIFYAGIVYYGYERLHRHSPSRYSSWVWMGVGVGFALIGIALTQLAQ